MIAYCDSSFGSFCFQLVFLKRSMLANRKKIDFFEENILEFYRKNGRKHLPWRSANITPYEVWVSEIMLQQTQVDRVIEYYTMFLRKFSTVHALSESCWEEFLPFYRGLGYYQRGRNMLKTAKIVVDQYRGVFPKDIKELRTLPGIGVYTAKAIASFGSNKNYLAWDTNFSRVFGRFFFGSKDAVIFPSDFEGKIVSEKRSFNGAIMDFGSLVCVKKPKCKDCFLQSRCTYFRKKGIDEQEMKKEGKKFPAKNAEAIVFLHKNHRIYYSKGIRRYRPFRVPAKWNTREEIKRYFQEKFHLSVSVRPPRKKLFVHGRSVMYMNAQILLGKIDFGEFTKQDVKKFF